MKRVFATLILGLFSALLQAADGEGKISRVEFIGKNYTAHPDMVQFRIEGNFSNNNCDNIWAGIKSADDHLISALLAAKIADKPVQVFLEPSDKYFGERCFVTGVVYP